MPDIAVPAGSLSFNQAAHRYWRINSITVGGGTNFEPSELQLFESGVNVNSSATITASTASGGGLPLSNISDGVLTPPSRCFWAEATAEDAGFWIKWDFGAGTPKAITGVKQGAYDTSGRHMSAFSLQWSDDDSTWTTEASFSGLSYPGNHTLSSEYVVFTPRAPTLSVASNIVAQPDAGAISVSGQAPEAVVPITLSPGAGVLDATGAAPSPLVAVIPQPDVGAAVLAGLAPTVSATEAAVISVPAGAISSTGQAPTTVATDPHTVTPGVGALVATGLDPVMKVGFIIAPGAGSIAATGVAPQSEIGGTTGEAEFDIPVPTLSASGITGTVGTAEFDIPLLTLSASDPGHSDIVLPMKTLVASGLTGTVGGAEFDLPLLELVATGFSNTHGTAEITLPAKTLAAAGLTGTVGSAAFDLPLLTLVAGSSGAEFELPAKTLEAAGVTGTVGSAEFTLPSLFLTASGYTGTVGTAEFDLPLLTLIAAGTAPTTGVAEFDLPLIQLFASGETEVPESYRTWALNMRNRALTEYENFDFNSYTEFNGAVLAAGADGIYVLGTQSLDDEDEIAARVKNGAMSYGSGQLKRIPRVYVHYEADGDAEITLYGSETTGRTYDLRWDGDESVHTRRVPIAKGPRSVRWQFEFANKRGGDFSLAGVTVWPEDLKRKVR